MNYYQVLEVNKNASQSAIKVAFKRLAVKYHPDKNPGSKWAETRFKEINNAYQVLSDPDKRANYDYKLSMGYASTPSTTPASRTPTYQYRRQRNVYRHRHWQYAREKNRLANIWAFGILGGITLVYLIIFGINYKLKSMAEEKMLNADEAVIQAARIKFDAGVFGEALAILDQHLQENSNRFRVMDIKKDYLKKVTASGYEKFYKQDYNSALRMFKLVYLYNAQQTVDFYDKIAKSSKKVGNFKDAAEAYEFITRKNPENLNAHLEAGILYNYNLKNYEKALIYFQKARELTIKDYINEYGKGFVLVFKPEQIPDSHYLVYCGLGMASHKLAMNHQASEALDWAILLRPNRPEAYYLKGVIFEDSGYPALACKNWNLAYHHGMEEAGRLAALNCPI